MMAYLPDRSTILVTFEIVLLLMGLVLYYALALALAIVGKIIEIALKVLFYSLVVSMVALIFLTLGTLLNFVPWLLTWPFARLHAPFTWRRWCARARAFDLVNMISELITELATEPLFGDPVPQDHFDGPVIDADDWRWNDEVPRLRQRPYQPPRQKRQQSSSRPKLSTGHASRRISAS